MVTQAQARSWTTPGAQGSAQNTYTAVKAALSRWAPLRYYTYETFLQGSYANHTNTSGDSDVDVVVMLTSTFEPDVTRLNPLEVLAFHRAYPKHSSTTIADFRREVTAALVDYFGASRVKPRNKCIRVDKATGYVDADVVPAYQYLRYLSFPTGKAPAVTEGIAIHPQSGGRVINYPKEHIRNGSAKNTFCHENYKPAVRQVKRLRRTAVDADLLGPKDAPGYLLECMTWNVPRELFVTDDLRRLHEVVTWLSRFSPFELHRQFMSCDNIHHLFRDDPGGHDAQRAHRVVQVLRSLL